MKTQIYLLITLTFLISLTSCKDKRIIDLDALASDGATGGGSITASTSLQSIIEGGTLAGLENSTVSLVTNTLTHLTTRANYESAKIEARYATENGAGANNGTNWANAWAATDLRDKINGISDATDSKVYAVLVASGTYKPVTTTTTATTTQRGISFSMKNHVAIIGGFTSTGSWERNGTTTFSGDIGTIGNSNDNSYRVFSHSNITLDNALLYGATITKGNFDTTDNTQDGGAGMYNKNSSPRLVSVVFSNNTTATGNGLFGYGGGMYNSSASPVLKSVVFEGNHANSGGGLYNDVDSSTVLTSVVFRSNSAFVDGGGVRDAWSSSVFKNVVFSGNSARFGGGLYHSGNRSSDHLVLVGAVFANNYASKNGGGISSARRGKLTMVNTVFTGNSAESAAKGHDINVSTDPTENGSVNIHMAGSVLGFGLANPTNGIKNTGTGIDNFGPINITYHSLTNTAVNLGSDSTTTGGLTYPTIQSTSSALNIGLHVRRSGTTYYFSEDGTTWYTGLLSTGGLDTSKQSNLPTSGVEDLTATDIAGNTRNGRPDAGVHEYR